VVNDFDMYSFHLWGVKAIDIWFVSVVWWLIDGKTAILAWRFF